MSDIRDDYLKFKVDDDTKGSNSFFSSIIKILVIVLLLLLLVVLGGLAYKYIYNDTKATQNNTIEPIQPQQSQTNEVVQAVQSQVNSGGSIKKEEIALIVKSVLAQMNQNKPVANTQADSQSIDSEIEDVVDSGENDAALLNQLSTSDVDNVQEQEMDLSSLDSVNTNTQVKTDVKKKDTFNKVVIDRSEVATKDDLSKLYAKLNSIMKKDKVKAKNSNYVKNLKKETKVRSNAMRIITVRRGDTLSLIAARAYGDAMAYPKIYEANPDLIKNPNLIYVGQKLRVPK